MEDFSYRFICYHNISVTVNAVNALENVGGKRGENAGTDPSSEGVGKLA